MNRFTLRGALVGIALCAIAINAVAQTNPTPFNLASGTYSFTTWNNTEPAGTYPASMVFHVFEQRIEPFQGDLDQAPNGNWFAAYNLGGGPRINGEGGNGVSFFQTGSGQSSNNCAFLGAAVLALNTAGRVNVNLSFVGQVTATGSRPYTMRLQYRYHDGVNYTAWRNAVGANGNYVEHHSTTTGTSAITHNWLAPLELENRSIVQVRWLYFQDGDGSGGRPRIRIDEIKVTSNNPTASVPTALAVFGVPGSLSANVPFQMIVRPVNAFGEVCNVTTPTNVQVSVSTGTGSVSGTTTGTITTNALTLSGVNYNTVENGVVLKVATTGGMSLTSAAVSRDFAAGASYSLMSGPINRAYAGVPMQPFTVTVYKADNTIDVGYGSPITVFLSSGPGSLSGTLSVIPFRGVATFDNVAPSTVGNIVLGVTVPGLPSKTLPTIQVLTAPKVSADIVPQYVNGRYASGTCSYSALITPAYARVTFTGLQPNTKYRYNVGASNTQMSRPTSTGGGFNIHQDHATGTYNYTGGKSLVNAGDYSEFSTTASETTKSIWINLLPTNASTFDPSNVLYWQIALADNDGNVIDIMQLSKTSALQDNGTGANQSTLIGDLGSYNTPKNFILLYDNTAGNTGPLGIAMVQPYNTAINFATNRYRFDVENVDGAWMTQIPNSNTFAVRRIEERDVNGNIVYAATSANGVWNNINTYPYSYGTPGGFSRPIYLNTPTVMVNWPAAGDTLCSGTVARIKYTAYGVSTVAIDYSIDGGQTFTNIDASETASKGYFDWAVPALGFQGNAIVRVRSVDRPEFGWSTPFTIVEPLSLITELDSKDMCIGDNDTLIAFVGGSIESYQWYKDGVAIPNENGPFLYLQDVNYQAAGVYWCVVDGYGQCGNITTNQAHIRVARKTLIATQTRAVAGIIGETVTMVVNAEFPSEVISYQWYRGQTMLAEDGHYFGTQSNRLEIRNFATTDYGNDYYCVVTGVCSSVNSRVIRALPNGVYAEFLADNYNACVGNTVLVNADVYSNPQGEELVIRWYRNGVMLGEGGKYTGTNTPVLEISNVTPADAGEYTVMAHLAVDETVRAEASTMVVIATAPTISQQPSPANACEGDAATFAVIADAQGRVEYQWNLNGAPVAGATESTYTIQTVTAARAGTYTVTVTTACGEITSAAVDLTVKDATVITTQPVATLDVQAGQPFDISVVATGSGTIQYQWFKDGVELTGEVAPTFSRTAAQASDAGEYHCRVTSECGPIDSDTSTITIRPVVSVDEDVFAGGVVIAQVAPNPTSTGARVSIMVPTSMEVAMTLVDASGRTVATIVNDMLPTGTHDLTIETTQLSAGVYALQTIVGGARHLQTVVVVK